MVVQENRFLESWEHGEALIPPEDIKSGGVTNEMVQRWERLQGLQVCGRMVGKGGRQGGGGGAAHAGRRAKHC